MFASDSAYRATNSDSSIDKRQLIRASFILFFALHLIVTILSANVTSPLMHYLNLVTHIVYIGVIFFTAGYDLNYLYRNSIDFRKDVLKRAFIFWLFFLGIAYVWNGIVLNLPDFSVIKDLLSLIKIPPISGILMTLTALYVTAAFVYPKLIKLQDEHRVIFPLLSAVGILTLLIPDQILGYGIIGLFIGADRAQCIPLAPYLIVIFWGVFAERDSDSKRSKGRYIIAALLTIVLGLGFHILGKNDIKMVFWQAGIGYLGFLILTYLLPLYDQIEKTVLALYHSIRNGWVSLSKKNQGKRFWDVITYILGFTLIFIPVTYLIIVPHIDNNIGFIWAIDGLAQYVPKIYRFMAVGPVILKSILHGSLNFPQYDFTNGLGGTIQFSFDPIYWLYLLFHPSQIESVYGAMIIFRFWLAGLAMSALLLYYKRSRFNACLASFIYCYSGYAVYAGSRHGQFITPMFLLPLLVIAMDRLITKKRWYMLTILVALSVLCSYYFLYMNTIALGIYFIARILYSKEYRNLKTFIGRGILIVISYVIGACIGCIALFTQFGSYMGSSRTGGSSVADFLSKTPLYYRYDWIQDAFISFLSASYTPGLWLKLGFAPIAMFAVILLFTRKNRKELRAIFLLFSLFCIFPICGFVFSGFSTVTNRWCFLYAAIVAVVTAYNLEHIPKLTQREIRYLCILTFFYGAVIYVSKEYMTDKILGVYGLMTITLITVLLINQYRDKLTLKSSRAIIMVVTLFAVISNAHMFIENVTPATGKTHLDSYVEAGTSYKRMTHTVLKYLDQVPGSQTKDFYRSTNLTATSSTRNSSMLLGYNDLSTFTSTLNGGIVNYNREMGNIDWNIVSIYSYNARTIMNELASVRYLGVNKEKTGAVPFGYKLVFTKEGKKPKYIYENRYALPIGYTYDSVMPTSAAEKMKSVEKQDATMQTALVDDQDAKKIPLKKVTTDSLSKSTKRLKISSISSGDIIMKDGLITIPEEGGKITFTFKGEDNAETYLGIRGDITAEKTAAEHFSKYKVVADDKNVNYSGKFRIDSYSTGQKEYLMNLGYHKKGLTECTLKFLGGATISYEDIAIYSQKMDRYPKQAAALKKNSLKNVRQGTNKISGEINCDQNKLLVITLPYQKGWTATVDGNKVPLFKANYQYMGLSLTPGHHKVVLQYQLPGLKLAFALTAAGTGIFLLIILVGFVVKRKRK
ncbi:MAG: YfhO family protein [Lachnospiraceae bacterium]|nr:YfhO family protein [Lachnospiraceae bacterium]